MGRSLRSRVAVFCLASAITAGSVGCAAPRPPAETLPLSAFFVRPVGPRGLEPTPWLLGLQGKRVLVQGFMVEEEDPYQGYFMLAALPLTLAERADGPADYLPPATLFVHLPDAQRDEIVRYVPTEVEVAGTLELGAKEETSGRISYVRLRLDDLSDARNRPKEQTE